MERELVVVLGLGYVGLPLAVSAANSGYSVIGFDVDQDKIQKLKKGISESTEVSHEMLLELQKHGFLQLTSHLTSLHKPAIFVIAVPTPLNMKREPELSMLESACEIIGSNISEGSLVINESTSYIGTLTQFIMPKISYLSNLSEIDFAVAPERIDPGNKIWNLNSTPRIVSGINERSTIRTKDFYSRFCLDVRTVSKPEVAEATKLFENTFRQVNIALVNEFSKIVNGFNLSTHEIIQAAASKPYGFMSFYPSIGVGGHCIPIDPTYLNYSAELIGLESSFINLSNKVNLDASREIALRILKIFDGDLNERKIQIAGISYKPNTSDIRESPALLLIKELSSLGATVSWHDPLVIECNGENSVSLDTNIDVGLIVTPHNEIDFSAWKHSGVLVLDLSPSPVNYGWPKFI